MTLSEKKWIKTNLVVPDISQLQTGFTLGGALKKNKLFLLCKF